MLDGGDFTVNLVADNNQKALIALLGRETTCPNKLGETEPWLCMGNNRANSAERSVPIFIT